MVLSGAYSSILQTSIILLGILIFTLAKPTNAQSALNNIPDSSFALLHERDTNYVHLLLTSARQQHKASPDSALVFYEKALQESKKLSFPKGETISYAGMGKYFLDKSTFRAAKIYLSRADSIAQKHGYENIRLRNAVHLATTLLMLGEFDEAASVIQLNTVLAQKHEDWKSLGLLHKNRGMIYGRQSNFQKALEANLTAITYFEKADFLPGVAGMHNNVGHIYAETGQSQNAIKQFEKARLIFRSIEDKSGEILCLNNIGNRYIEIEKIDSAIHYLYAANKLIKQLDRKLELLYNCLSISDALAKKGKLIEAEKFIQEANTLCEQMGKNDLLPYVYIPLATVREKQNRIEAAKTLHLKAVRMAEAHAPPNQIMGIKKAAAEFLVRHKFFEQALIYTKDAQSIQDSIFNEKKSNQIAALQTQFETKEKEKENTLLRKENELQALKIQQQRRSLFVGTASILIFSLLATFLFLQQRQLIKTKGKLETSLKEKETLLKEIHHRVKNNLQIITSFLRIQAEKDAPQTIEDFLTQGQNRVKSMALIHEQLYRSENISSINMQEYAENLVKSIIDTHGSPPVSYKVDSRNTQLTIDQAIPLGLIVNELVTNSLKHAFNEKTGGNLLVQMKENTEQVAVKIKDNGPGFIPAASTGTIGLQVVGILVRQLKGTLRFEHETGTTAVIVFPKA